MNARILRIRTAGSLRLFSLTALVAGLIAGTIATVAQMLLWWLAAAPLPETFYRDTRLAAAIVLPRSVIASDVLLTLPSWLMLLTATLIHFALSALYAAIFIYFAVRLRVKGWCLPLFGLAFGLALYLVNMHGFTALFPWFVLARDWITVAAHAVFGLSLGMIVRTNTRFIVPLLPF